MKPYSECVRNTNDGWVNPHNWVIGFYKENEELRNLLCSRSGNITEKPVFPKNKIVPEFNPKL